MKNLSYLFFITLLLAVNVSCSENENMLNPEKHTISMADSIARAKAATENKDSLNPQKYIYLTIDDAPLNGSEYIDSVILSQKIKTNLFIVGNPIAGSGRFLKYFKLFQKNPYVEMYNHSYTHAHNRYANFYKNPELVLADFEQNQTEFSISHKIARLPGRNLWEVGKKKKNYKQTGATSAELLAKNGYKIFGWDVEWGYSTKDYSAKESIDELVKIIEDSCDQSKTFTPKHIVLLMHDQMFAKVSDKNNLGELISTLKDRGFIFEYLSSYPE